MAKDWIKKVNYSLQTQIKIVTLVALSTLLLGSLVFSKRILTISINQFQHSQTQWLQVYSQSIFEDLKLSRTQSIQKKLNFLVQKGFFQKITIQSGSLNLNSNSTTKSQDFLVNWIMPMVVSSENIIIELPLQDIEKSKWGYIKAEISSSVLFKNVINQSIIYLGLGFGLSFIILGFILLGSERWVSPIIQLTEKVRSKIHVEIPKIRNEIIQLEKTFDLYELEIINSREIIKKQSRLSALSEIAKQVSHDIRSPLSALNLIAPTLAQIPEEKRLLIRSAVNRINDIANSLLEKSKISIDDENKLKDSLNNSKTTEVLMLSSLIDSIVSEKRIQYKENIKVNIEFNQQNAYGLFISANGIEIKRVISNLINNSVEAFGENYGKIEVDINSKENQVIVLVKDNGRGIPDFILRRLGEKGISNGKEGTSSGNGLGIYHAKTTIESFNGTFLIESVENNGTSIQLVFPKVIHPNWFVSELSLVLGQSIIICDDDSSIHNLWTERFSEVNYQINHIQLFHFSSSESLTAWVKKGLIFDKILFLIDYELLNSPKTGLDLIEELGIASNSILVTSRFEEFQIQERCKKLGVHLIPKGLASLVPIKIHC